MRSSFRLAALAALLAAASLARAADPPADRPRTCLVLSGGGARGVAHVGLLKVIEELRVPIDCIVGTSMGALIGGAYASGIAPQEIERIVRSIDWDRVLADQPSRPDRSFHDKALDRANLTRAEFGIRDSDLVLPLGALVGQQLETVLRSLAGGPIVRDSFDNLPIPYRAIATDAENGKMAVIDRGSVTTAMRASMSVPGVFAPQEIEGRLFIDGGLVRNLGVDVARGLGAQRIIAVNLGSPLLKRDKLDSVLGLTEQMVNILTEQNVQTSLAQLGPDDILIEPELGDFSAADFEHSPQTIEIGERAARKAAERLRQWSVPEDEYQRYLALREQRVRDERYARVEIDTSGLKRVSAQSVIRTFEGATQGRLDDEALQRGLTALYTTDDFELVNLGVTGPPNDRTLIVRPREKQWGPNYGRVGLTLSTDVAGNSALNLLGDYRMTWLDRRGLEWRNTFSLGTRNLVDSELFQPLDATRRWFVAGGARLQNQIDDVYAGDEAVARYRNRVIVAHVDVGRYFGATTEARLGYEYGRAHFRRDTGSPLLPSEHDDIGVVSLTAAQDTFDDWEFPRSGHFLRAAVRVAAAELGSGSHYTRWQVDAQQAFARGAHSVTLGATAGDLHGDDTMPPFELFSLGGFQALSGSADRQFLGNDVLFGRAVYRYRVPSGSGSSRRLYVGGSIEAGRMQERLNSLDARDMRLAGSLFVAAGTPLGAVYLSAGYTEGGGRAFYLFLGRP